MAVVSSRERFISWSPATTANVALAVTSLAAAGIHFAVMGDHFAEWFLAGLFFSVAAWLQALWAVGVVVSLDRRLLMAGLVGNLAVALIWTISRTRGLPIGPEPGTPEALGFADVLSTVLEVLLAAGCVILLAARSPIKLPGGRTGLAAVFALTLALALLTTTAIATAGGHGGEQGAHETETVGPEQAVSRVDLGAGRQLAGVRRLGADPLHLLRQRRGRTPRLVSRRRGDFTLGLHARPGAGTVRSGPLRVDG